MPDPQLVKSLYARQTLAEMTSGLRQQADLPADSDLGMLIQAQVLVEQGKASEAQQTLIAVMERAQESRVMLWTSKALRDLGLWPEGPLARQAQGVVFEVPMEEDQDILAVYRDNSVRFFSYGGAMTFYEPSSGVQDIDQLCQQIMSAADQISETPQDKPPSHQPGDPRVTVLTISGEVPADAEATDTLLGLGAQIIGTLYNLRQQ